MQNRPVSIIVIGIWMIFSAVVGLFGAVTMQSNPIAQQMIEQMHMNVAFQQAVGIIGATVAAACAYGLFKGQPWSRVLYVGWSVIGLAIAFVTSPMKSMVIVSVLIVAAVAFFLFRPDADRYFAAKGLQLQRGDA